MAVNEYRLQSSEFVQHWVNSLPPVRESDLYQAVPLSSPSTSTSSYEAVRGEAYPSSRDVSEGHNCLPLQPISVGSSAHNHDVQPPHREPRGSLPSSSAEKKCLHRKSSRLSWMHSNYSSFNSEASSIELLLEERKANPEEVLINLGFGVTDSSIASRLPSRFLVSRTRANGINMQSFVQGHPELSRYMAPENNLAMGELERRLPHYYRQVAVTESHTSLHKQFSSSSLELQGEQAFTPFTVHEGEDGTTFSSILTKSNTEQLAKQGFYSEHSPTELAAKNSSDSSISTHDCTIDSVETPSPIILNNSPSASPSSIRNPFITSQSSGSDSVFSSTESFMMDQKLRVKLEAIHEKSLNEISDEDLEEGISFISRRRSDSELVQPQEVRCEPVEEKQVSIHRRRKAFARSKSRSLDEEGLSEMLRDKLEAYQPEPSASHSSGMAPVIVTTHTCQDPGSEPVVPKQADGLLQVMFNPESFDSVDSDAGTIVPSPYASPCQGMSPNTSRNGSLSVLPAGESFELEEVQSTADSSAAQSATRLKRTRLQRSVSQRSDSDSSGIADIDCKSSQGQNDNPGNGVSILSSQRLELPTAFSSSTPSAKSSTASVHTSSTRKIRRSSDSDASDLKYCSLSSEPSSVSGQAETPYGTAVMVNKREMGTQTEVFTCSHCGGSNNLQAQPKYNREWQINNPAHPSEIGHASSAPSGISNQNSSSIPASRSESAAKPRFFIVNGETEVERSMTSSIRAGSTQADSIAHSSDEPDGSASSLETDSRVDDLYSDMAKDLRVLKVLISKYGIDSFSPSTDFPQQENLKKELLSGVHLVKSFLSSNSSAHQDQWTQSESSFSSLEDAPCLPSNSHLVGPQSTRPSMSQPPKMLPSLSTGPSTLPADEVMTAANPSSPSLHNQTSLRDAQNYSFVTAAKCCGFSASKNLQGGSAVQIVSTNEDQELIDTRTYSERCRVTESLHLAPPILDWSGSVSGTVQTPSTGYAPSSISSSVSRLSDKLNLANSKSCYEKKIAELEMQKYELTLKMKNEEIEYWKSLAESALD